MNTFLTKDGYDLIQGLIKDGGNLKISHMWFADINHINKPPITELEGFSGVDFKVPQNTQSVEIKKITKVSNNKLIFSAELNANQGKFYIDTIMLYSQEHKKVIAVSYVPRHYKYNTDSNRVGNTLFKNFALVFNGIDKTIDLTKLETISYADYSNIYSKIDHNHDTLTYNKSKDISNTDLNDLNTGGFYDGCNLINAPEQQNKKLWWYITVQCHSQHDIWIAQTALHLGSSYKPKYYIRRCMNGHWEQWEKIGSSVGSVMALAMKKIPSGYLECNGAAVHRNTYAALFAKIGTTFGAGDGSTTFNLPDLRGEFIRGFDNGRGVDANRNIGSAQSDEFKSHNHVVPQLRRDSHDGGGAPTWSRSTAGTEVTTNTGGNETRPRNIALMYCIKY